MTQCQRIQVRPRLTPLRPAPIHDGHKVLAVVDRLRHKRAAGAAWATSWAVSIRSNPTLAKRASIRPGSAQSSAMPVVEVELSMREGTAGFLRS
jgi:hypothetical protein